MALQLIQSSACSIAVVDVSMPGLTGVEFTECVTVECPGTKVLVLKVHEDTAYLQPQLEAGASGYLLKRSTVDDQLRAVHAVAAGGVYLDLSVAGHAFADNAWGLAGRRTARRSVRARRKRCGSSSRDPATRRSRGAST